MFFQSLKMVWLVSNSLGLILPFSSRYVFTSSSHSRPFLLFMAMLVLQARVQPDALLCYHPHFVRPFGWLRMPLACVNHPNTGFWSPIPCPCHCPSCMQGQSLWGKHLQKPLLPDIGSTISLKSILGLMTAGFICIIFQSVHVIGTWMCVSS